MSTLFLENMFSFQIDVETSSFVNHIAIIICSTVENKAFEFFTFTLLAMIDLLTDQSSTPTQIHNAILFIDTATMLDRTILIHFWGHQL